MTPEVQWHGAIIGYAGMGEVRCNDGTIVGHAEPGIDRVFRDIGNIHMGMGMGMWGIRACGIGLKEGWMKRGNLGVSLGMAAHIRRPKMMPILMVMVKSSSHVGRG